ncbi:aminomethyl-transferring glycine dehydrogenase subunit GcvPA [Facklamia miroungae]|uniref:Probable glycine dehydrogenase (decarboxylating) subunit 1 n=1 Tax=Facklamia miroungae TaxID=120956 RepID=A0A1G7TJZ0_9LACT|nr:aminomethyl-transferring glycine dehydrogenase subunit GcvPA [Facklamia miroungae]NKZ29807.1 aminomethyl-transferring glycine dehydrogenase subunit GcvPA [Facklamia miroungae]SDG35595.1 glycine dehydrogenase subunit 1 [Facklamia miroungae]
MANFRYLPNTEQDRQAMLETIGVKDIMDIFSDLPENVRREGKMNLPEPLSEMEIVKEMTKMAALNTSSSQKPFFLGAGTYDHHVPSIVKHIIMRQEFLTAYVPYQPEVSQGELQALFEWQTMIAELTGMDLANCGMYDGYNAVSEAANLAFGHVKKSNKVLVSKGLNPQAIETVKTYGFGKNYSVEEIALENEVTSLEDLKAKLNPEVAAVIVQYPNFFGSIEDLKAIKAVLEGTKTLLIVSANPLALGKLEKPGALGADITVGDVQPFGIPMSLGGPHCGYFAVNDKLMRKIPSRIVGETVDEEGRRGFVMTLSTREQHIRREKATSNYSSNQALFALSSSIAMSAYGKVGIQELAQANINNTHYLAKELKAAGFEVVNTKPFFNEFVIKLNKDIQQVNKALFEKGFVGGFDASKAIGMENAYLLCATEKRTKEEMDDFVTALVEVAK